MPIENENSHSMTNPNNPARILAMITALNFLRSFNHICHQCSGLISFLMLVAVWSAAGSLSCLHRDFDATHSAHETVKANKLLEEDGLANYEKML
jgi:hypothetical protein